MNENNKKFRWLVAGGVTLIAIGAISFVYAVGQKQVIKNGPILPFEKGVPRSGGGFLLPIAWGDLGIKLSQTGVIDQKAFLSLYQGEEQLEAKALLTQSTAVATINEANAGLWLNALWAFGLANKNPILEQGPMSDARYGGAGGFASTGGWTIAKGNPMTHFSHHAFIQLTPDEQALVERVSKNIYRPCCDNSTYFPDCNHGMAMLGLLELMAANGVSEDEMYRVALGVNRLWFPGNYATIDQFLLQKGIKPEAADPKQLLGREFSSGSGYQKILAAVTTPAPSRGASCGI